MAQRRQVRKFIGRQWYGAGEALSLSIEKKALSLPPITQKIKINKFKLIDWLIGFGEIDLAV